jgi:hypothetical protein
MSFLWAADETSKPTFVKLLIEMIELSMMLSGGAGKENLEALVHVPF